MNTQTKDRTPDPVTDEPLAIIHAMPDADRPSWQALLDTGRVVSDAESALRAARRALSQARAAERKADRAFKKTATGEKWIAAIRKGLADRVAAAMRQSAAA